jgi:hypothetical protein
VPVTHAYSTTCERFWLPVNNFKLFIPSRTACRAIATRERSSELDPAHVMSVFRQKRKRVDTAARDTIITSSTDVAAVTIDEDEDAAADTTSSVAADDTTSSVADNPITRSADVAAVTIDEDDGAAADTTSSVTRSPCDQFSTPERVTLYHRIMPEQFTVGQRVRVQYGTNASEFWFPAVIGR